VKIDPEALITVLKTSIDHPFIPLENFSTDLQQGDFVGCIGYNCIPEGDDVNQLWKRLPLAEQEKVRVHKWRPTVSDVEQYTRPEFKIIAPGVVLSISDLSARVTSTLYWGSTCGIVLRFRTGQPLAVVGRVEGTVWEAHANEIFVHNDGFHNLLQDILLHWAS